MQFTIKEKPPFESPPMQAGCAKQMKSKGATQKKVRGKEKQSKQKSHLSFSTTRMTEMLKVVNHATRLIMSTPPSAFCL